VNSLWVKKKPKKRNYTMTQKETIRAAKIVKKKHSNMLNRVPRRSASNLKRRGIGQGALSWQEREREEEEEEQVSVPTVAQFLSLRASKIKALRFVPLDEWFPDPRLARKGPFSSSVVLTVDL
jgi:hypothetical protein